MELEEPSPIKEVEAKRGSMSAHNICAPIISIFLGLFCFSAFVAIEPYMELGCDAGLGRSDDPHYWSYIEGGRPSLQRRRVLLHSKGGVKLDINRQVRFRRRAAELVRDVALV